MQPAGQDQADVNEKHGRGEAAEAQALRMLDLFASVGVEAFDITHTNIDGTKRGYRPAQTLEQTRTSMPFLLRAARRRENNVIVRPHQSPAVSLVQLDDLPAAAVHRIGEAAFLVLETSRGNFQAWVAIDKAEGREDPDFARRLRKGAGADPSASGATRVAGTVNFKRRYEPDFPLVAIAAGIEGRIMGREELEARGLVAAPEPAIPAPSAGGGGFSRRARGRWPSYQYCVDRAPLAHGGDHPDISRADFAWCMTAIDWGWSVDDTAARLMEESGKAQENGEGYALATARNAAAAIERRYGKLPSL
jgi:hypothetical protein